MSSMCVASAMLCFVVYVTNFKMTMQLLVIPVSEVQETSTTNVSVNVMKNGDENAYEETSLSSSLKLYSAEISSAIENGTTSNNVNESVHVIKEGKQVVSEMAGIFSTVKDDSVEGTTDTNHNKKIIPNGSSTGDSRETSQTTSKSTLLASTEDNHTAQFLATLLTTGVRETTKIMSSSPTTTKSTPLASTEDNKNGNFLATVLTTGIRENTMMTSTSQTTTKATLLASTEAKQTKNLLANVLTTGIRENTMMTSTSQTTAQTTLQTSTPSQAERRVDVTSDVITKCLHCNGTGVLTVESVSAGSLTFHSPRFDDPDFKLGEPYWRNMYLTCKVRVILPAGTFLEIRVRNVQASCNESYLGVPNHNNICGEDNLDGILPFNDVVLFFCVYYQPSSPVTFVVNFTAIPALPRPTLEVVYNSSKEGMIKTPDWKSDGNRDYSAAMDSTARVLVPAGHVIMISFPELYVPSASSAACSDYEVFLYVGGNSSSNMILNLCRDFRFTYPKMFNTTVVYLQLRSSRINNRPVVKMLFTFHPYQAAPQVNVSSGRWNCSSALWPVLKSHFPCNLRADCESGIDEMGCSYYSDKCRIGDFSLKGRCYRYMLNNNFASLTSRWDKASKACGDLGGRMASFSDHEVFDQVTRLMHRHYPARTVLVGLQTSSSLLPYTYKMMLQWTDETVAYNVRLKFAVLGQSKPGCLYVSTPESYKPFDVGMYLTKCNTTNYYTDFICEYLDTGAAWREGGTQGTAAATRLGAGGRVTLQREVKPLEVNRSTSTGLIVCPGGHTTFPFLACDTKSACWAPDLDLDPTATCLPPNMTSPPPSFVCGDGMTRVPYTLVCDHRADCGDHSDEDFCVFPACPSLSKMYFSCGVTDRQCVAASARCDGLVDCVSGLDELQCPEESLNYEAFTSLPPPALVLYGGQSGFITHPLNASLDGPVCPETHFQCAGNGYCLPVYVRCNGVFDCPGHEDEADCSGPAARCPGYVRCRGSSICLHPSHVCDGVRQCPQHEDELLCQQTCPSDCTCLGLAFICRAPFTVAQHGDLRFLNASDSGMTVSDLTNNSMLVHVSLARCGLQGLGSGVYLPNMRSLDLANNRIQTLDLDVLSQWANLVNLVLAGNPLTFPFVKLDSDTNPIYLRSLDLSNVKMPVFNATHFHAFPTLQSLDLSSCGVDEVVGEGFGPLTKLRVLDLRGCPVRRFPKGMFEGLIYLHAIQADNYKLCCPALLPVGFVPGNCRAASDEISSCDALLSTDLFRVFLSLVAALALVGNAGSLVYRNRSLSTATGFGVFVNHLCVSDLLMGVYLLIIGVADRLYMGSYLWKDVEWKESGFCQLAGFLALLSSEVSTLLVCLITLDRCLVLQFPFSRWRFGRRSAHAVSGAAWLAGAVMAAVPLLPDMSHWRFYSQTSICLPLPFTRQEDVVGGFDGYMYSFSVLICLNLALVVLIAVGQGVIYLAVTTNSMSSTDTTRKTRDLTVARRLVAVAMTDFLCWFPIGLLGLLAERGFPIPGKVNVAMAVFVLPLNSALNPFLYTLNVVLERRRKIKEKELEARMLLRLKSEMATGRSATLTSGKSESSQVSVIKVAK